MFSISLVEVTLRLSAAMLVGYILGWERKHRKKPIGIITICLVCVGSAILALYQDILFLQGIQFNLELVEKYNISWANRGDKGRIVAQIISGIGFLGAGTIIQRKGNIEGITTAATLWVAAALGIVIGSGLWLLAGASCLVIFIILFVLKNPFPIFLLLIRSVHQYRIECTENLDLVYELGRLDVRVLYINILELTSDTTGIVKTYRVAFLIPRYVDKNTVQEHLNRIEGIFSVEPFTKLSK